jgi:hypothetical protein
MDFIEIIGDHEKVEYEEEGECGGPQLSFSTNEPDSRDWIIYNPVKLYNYLKRLNDMGVLKEG